MGPIKILFNNCLVRQNVIQVHKTPVLQCHGTNQSNVTYMSGPAESNTNKTRSQNDKRHIKEVLDNYLVQQNVIQVHKTPVLQMQRDQSTYSKMIVWSSRM